MRIEICAIRLEMIAFAVGDHHYWQEIYQAAQNGAQ